MVCSRFGSGWPAGVVTALDASGKDVVIVETVGAGQDEVEIAMMADTTVVVVTPGAGDDVQAMKAGIMEIADVLYGVTMEETGLSRLISVDLNEKERTNGNGHPVGAPVTSDSI